MGPLIISSTVYPRVCGGTGPKRQRKSRRKAVYPRVCGGTRGRRCEVGTRHGLSPRVRGNHQGRRPTDAARGSIPACAGEPSG